MTFNLADLFDRVANAVPEREALVFGGERFTYRQMQQRVNSARNALFDMGVRAGDRVGVALRNSPAYLEVMLAAFGMGAIPVNINYRYLEVELNHIFVDSGVKVVFCEPQDLQLMARVATRVPALPRIVSNGARYNHLLAAYPSDSSSNCQRSDHDLYILYTGGTTGMPKGVVWHHIDIFYAAMGGNIRTGVPITVADDIVKRVGPNPTRTLFAAPFVHGTAQWMAFLTLFRGGTILLSTYPSLDVGHLLDLIDAEAASYLVLVGDAIALPLSDLLQEETDRWDLSTLTTLVSGGAALSVPVREVILGILPWIVVVDSYGTSETGGQASMVYAAGMPQVAGQPQFELRKGSALLDEHHQPIEAASQQVGRVARSGHIPICYFQDPEATAATFPTVDGTRWALTGDLAYLNEDNKMVLLGRGSNTINSGGEKIYPGEVEAVLHAHTSVRDAVVVGIPDMRWGEQVAALVVIKPGHSFEASDIDEHCRANLADYKTPRIVKAVSNIERLESGKPDYRWALECAVDAAQRND